MLFSEIIGQEKVKQSLIQTVKNGRISHAQLFLGPEGNGSLALAIAYAQYINCLQPTDTDSCGTCSSCVKFQKLQHPDLHFSFPVIVNEKQKVCTDFYAEWISALSNDSYLSELNWLLTLDEEAKKQGNISAAECREIIKRLGLKSFEAKFKTMIIWLPEYMGYEANILLKLLEEPPVGTLIIMVSHDADKMLATILSRTQLFKIPRLKDEDIIAELVSKHELTSEMAAPISRVCEGNIVLARELAETGRSNYHELFVRWMRAVYSNVVKSINEVIEEIISYGKEFIKSFVMYSMHMMRAVLLTRYADASTIRLSEQEHQFMLKFAQMFHQQNISEIVAEMNKSLYGIERNGDLRLTFLNLSFYISRRLGKPQTS
jgi:DNA polymerase-3 subunit delta'